MEQIIEFLYEFNEISVIIRIILAAVMGGLIGSERGRHGRAAGLRTHILVCVGAAMTSLTGIFISQVLGFDGDVARIAAQVISGIGFLGAGTIMVRNSSVITGLTTAAGMWATAAIGVATGYGFYIGAAVATIVCIFSVTVLSHLERSKKNNVNVYIELSDIGFTNNIIAVIEEYGKEVLSYDVMPPKSGKNDNVGILCCVSNEKTHKKLEEQLEKIDEVVYYIAIN